MDMVEMNNTLSFYYVYRIVVSEIFDKASDFKISI